MSRIINVSNRLPVTVRTEKIGYQFTASSGGLATGLKSLSKDQEMVWIGWPGTEISTQEEQIKLQRSMAQQKMVPVFLSDEEIHRYYEGFSNKTIWPHFHYFTQYTQYSETTWKAYQEVNEKFANVVSANWQPGDLIWIHDYQLMLLPNLLRQRHPDATIGFFLHIPFPSFELFRTLPWRVQILEGLLGADQIGFHTFGYLRHFLSAAYRIGGYDHYFGKLEVKKRIVNVDVFPMGIDYDQYANPSFDIFEYDDSFKIKQLSRGKKLILSVDRLDYSKGIPQRIRAFSRFLEQYPAYQGKVSMVLIVVPSRAKVDQYKELKQEIDTRVGKVNGQFGDFSWTPIQYLYRSLSFSELVTLYQEADIALVTPLRDGMNLIAKEFVASKEHHKKGVLILSEMAGAANELSEALLVNPNDVHDLVSGIHKALEMTEEEQRWRLENMQERLRDFDVKHWANSFLSELDNLMLYRNSFSSNLLDRTQWPALKEAYSQADNKLIFLDYDGTLMNFHNDPKAVSPDAELLVILQQLSTTPGTKVIINSGRDKNTLEEWLGNLPLEFAAEHGVWTYTQGKWQRDASVSDEWKKDIRPIMESIIQRTPGSFLEEKDYSLVWHYRRVDKDLAERRLIETKDQLLYLTANLDLQVMDGNKVLEVKPIGVNKGKACLKWLNSENWDFIMAIGDDYTDEDIFKVVPDNAYSIKVGGDKTAARFNLPNVEEVRSLLALLAVAETPVYIN